MNARALAGSNVVLLVCGSFNPPTILHLRMFECARDFLQQECKCTVLEGLLSPVSDHFRAKKPSLAQAEHRLRMAELATESSSWIQADGWECRRERWSRTIEVLRHHRESMHNKYASLQSLRLVLVCGGDLVDSFTRTDPSNPGDRLWNHEHLKEIMNDYGMIVVERVGSNARQTLASKELDFLKGKLDKVAIIEDDTFPNEMSSTRLRDALRRGRSIRYCTPDPVVEYILRNGLYTQEWERQQQDDMARFHNRATILDD